MSNIKCLVTGGAGFIGSHLVEKLLQQNYSVHVLDNLSTGQKSNVNLFNSNNDYRFFNFDIRDRNNFANLDKDYTYIFHLAGLADIVPSIEKPTEYFDTNATGTLNIVEFAKNIKCLKKVVYAASSSCYGIPSFFPTKETDLIKPEYPYALSKYIGEELLMHWSKIYKIPTISLRLFNVYGPRSRTSGAYGAVFGVFLAQKLNNKPFTIVGDGNQTRDFTFVYDVADAFISASHSNINNEVFNVGSGNHYSINYLTDLLGGKKTYIPKRPGEPDCTFADISKIKNLIGWQPKITIEGGVQVMLDHINDWSNAPLWDNNSIMKATETWFKFLS